MKKLSLLALSLFCASAYAQEVQQPDYSGQLDSIISGQVVANNSLDTFANSLYSIIQQYVANQINQEEALGYLSQLADSQNQVSSLLETLYTLLANIQLDSLLGNQNTLITLAYNLNNAVLPSVQAHQQLALEDTLQQCLTKLDGLKDSVDGFGNNGLNVNVDWEGFTNWWEGWYGGGGGGGGGGIGGGGGDCNFDPEVLDPIINWVGDNYGLTRKNKDTLGQDFSDQFRWTKITPDASSIYNATELPQLQFTDDSSDVSGDFFAAMIKYQSLNAKLLVEQQNTLCQILAVNARSNQQDKEAYQALIDSIDDSSLRQSVQFDQILSPLSSSYRQVDSPLPTSITATLPSAIVIPSFEYSFGNSHFSVPQNNIDISFMSSFFEYVRYASLFVLYLFITLISLSVLYLILKYVSKISQVIIGATNG